MNRPRIVVAGTHSGVGKTTLTLGLIAALKRRQFSVQSFKVGPDYIDPAYHTALTGRPSRNLDSWMLRPDTVRGIFLRASEEMDISVIEGVMGFYDGKGPATLEGSTAEISLLIQSPVLLIVDAGGMARSASAIVKGFQTLDPAVHIAGVLVNRVGSKGHYGLLKEAIEADCQIPVVGYLPQHEDITIPERHLGLVPAIERGELNPLFERLAQVLEATVDLDAIYQIACAAPELTVAGQGESWPTPPGKVVIAVAKDEAFNFYYPENFELLEHYGAKIQYFSPLHGETVPADASGLYIGGGFPEEFAAQLSAQKQVIKDLALRILTGLPTYAECGGHVYLTKTLTDRQGQVHKMVGIVPAHVKMQEFLVGFGYREVKGDNWLIKDGETARGHEFHYSSIEYVEDHTPAYEMSGHGAYEGYRSANVISGYTHLHFQSNPNLAKNFVDACASYRRSVEEKSK